MPATALGKQSLTNARRYDTQAALGPSGILILNSCQNKDSQFQIPKSYKSSIFHGKATSQREHTEGSTAGKHGKRSSTRLQNQELARLNKLQSYQNLNCISSLQADNTARAPPLRAVSNFNSKPHHHNTNDESKSMRSLHREKHYGLQNIQHSFNNVVNANIHNPGSTNSAHQLNVNAPSILKQ